MPSRLVQRGISRRLSIRLNYFWPLHARDSQLPSQRRLGHLAHPRRTRIRKDPPIARIVVSIDPAMSTRPTSSETGIVVVGADMRRQDAYILADESGRLTPNNMALRVAHLFDKFNATQIVVEANAGGNHVETTLRNAIERTLPINSIRARHGKQIRACPVP